MRERIRWLALHGVVRGISAYGVRRGDPQARLIADPAVRADPAPFADEMRRRGPIVRGRALLMTFDYDVATDLLRSDDFRVSRLGGNLPKPLRWVADKTYTGGLHPLLAPSLLAVEPPDHTRYRKLVSSVFTTRAVSRLRERVQETANELLDAMDGGVVDIVEQYCALLPVAVISDILGVPDADRSQILRFGELGAPSLDIGLTWRQYQQVNSGIHGFETWLTDHLRQLRRNPGEDLLSQIIQASDAGAAGKPLDESELRALAGLVLAAGFETTVNLLGNGIRMLLDHPDHLQTLASRPDLWPNAVEEILRLDSPVLMSARVARVDTEVAGTQVQADELVIVHLAGANRDPAVFTDPHRFDIERDNAGRHLSFSGGRHFCLGAALARAEGQVGLQTFFERFPDARPAGQGSRRETRILRGWSTLPIALGKARAAVSS
ncbi:MULTISPECIES: cytochrome P450 [Mycolicibacterium]|uniref:Steroid C26-monooxygenase n=1 Tax=Mycolicibacterium senegalense TaxID=1796 RepID=A0A378W5D1_9MYCO|nr:MULTISPECIES: cytochrome P450 [Mycolicibacterium]MCV7333696.1 cytochrome P450 [Mycolicibacterium senegalense]MDR7288169.1 cytochrome P450 [Mycolicibacterium senegalense]QZA25142.1 cytochrome P450 [Mycolicibacterium senegalense]CDP85998.1 cytochrome P450 [Mycolicibacterium farcinogenes]SUA28255.1 cytochrome P450 140 cyp140 [Mycolicibacterium senegalense]